MRIDYDGTVIALQVGRNRQSDAYGIVREFEASLPDPEHSAMLLAKEIRIKANGFRYGRKVQLLRLMRRRYPWKVISLEGSGS